MPATGLAQMDGFLKALRDDLTAINSAVPPQEFKSAVELLETRAQRLRGILDALVADENRPASVTLTLPAYDDQRRQLMRQLGTEDFASKFVGNLWRVLRVGTQRVRTEEPADKELGRFLVSEGNLRIDFFKEVDDDSPDRTFTLGSSWAALQLVQQPFARRLPGGKDWDVMISLKDGSGQDRFLMLRLTFEKPLPEIDQWPTAAASAWPAPIRERFSPGFPEIRHPGPPAGRPGRRPSHRFREAPRLERPYRRPRS